MSTYGALQAGAQSATLQTIPSMPLATFQDSLGVDIHIEYTDGKYADANQVLKDLQYLGIHNVRDGIPNSGWLPAGQGLNGLKLLAQNGVHFDFVTECNLNLDTSMASLDSLIQQYPGIAVSVEGPNEINNFPCRTGSGNNEQNGENFQKALYSHIQNDSHFPKNFPVLYMTGAAPINLHNQGGFANVANTHPYPYKGVQPFARLQSDFNSYFSSYTQSDPHQITETGYATIPNPSDPDGVDPLAQGELILNLYFDAALQGNTHTYLYQLLEAYPNYATSSDTAFGFFNYNDGSPKAIAQVLHNIAQILPPDKPSSQQTVQATITGLPSTAHTLALTGSDGSVTIFMWNEQPVWNAASDGLLYVNPQYVQVKMPGSWNVSYFAPSSTTLTPDPEYQGAHWALLGGFPTALIFRKQ